MSDMDAKFKEEIGRMDLMELLALVLVHSGYLTDTYYSDFGRVIRDRAEELGVDK